LAKKALIQIEEDRKADRAFSEQMIARTKATGFDPGKDLVIAHSLSADWDSLWNDVKFVRSERTASVSAKW
jgi:hypothetical protein